MFSLGAGFLLASLSHLVHSQLLSCTDVGCTAGSNGLTSCSFGTPRIDTLGSLGVANITTALSSQPLSWIEWFYHDLPTGSDKAPTYTRSFYLGQPQSTNLRENSSVTACALFFNDIALDGRGDPSIWKGTCEDVLTTSCVRDWTQQAENFAKQSEDSDFCKNLADELQAHRPASCAAAKESWEVKATKMISGPELAPAVSTQDCNMTVYSRYSQTKVFASNSSDGNWYSALTPILTVIKPANSDGYLTLEAHLSCMKPVYDGNVSTEVITGAATAYKMPGSTILLYFVWFPLYWLLFLA